MRAWVVLLFLGVAVLLLLGGHLLTRNLHATFFLGLLPLSALLMSMFALGVAFSITVRVRAVQYFRNSRWQAEKQLKSNAKSYNRECCEVSLGCLRFMLFLVAATGAASLTLGVFVLRRGHEASDGLLSCGKDGVSKEIDTVQKQLAELHTTCRATEGFAEAHVHKCPGFEEAFPDPRPYVDYLARLETLEFCSGFCSKPATRFFTEAPGRKVGESTSSDLCAPVISHQLKLVSCVVGTSVIVLGSSLVLKAALLFDYDHL